MSCHVCHIHKVQGIPSIFHPIVSVVFLRCFCVVCVFFDFEGVTVFFLSLSFPFLSNFKRMKNSLIGFIVLAACVCSVLADSCTIGKLNVHPTEKVDFDTLVAKPQKFDKKWVSFTAIVSLFFSFPFYPHFTREHTPIFDT